VNRRESSLSTSEVKVVTVTSKLKLPPMLACRKFSSHQRQAGGSLPPVMPNYAQVMTGLYSAL